FKGLASSGPEDTKVGKQAIQEASDSFFVWIELHPSKFWVNLNPSEPNRIIDSQLGRTDVGRILLQADLHLKESSVALIDPNTTLGAQFWQKMDAARLNAFCIRNSIVPAPATVRDTGSELYILDAPLQVKTDADYFQIPGAGSGNVSGCPADSSGATAIFRSLIVPEMEKAVNQAPEYAALRRVYYSRVAAEWYRQRNSKQSTSVNYFINRNNIDRWVSKQPWKPKDIFDKYVSELNATTYTWTDGNFIRTVQTGGVDFSQPVSFNALSDSDFLSKAPGLSNAVTQSFTKPTTDNNRQFWLGASNVETLSSLPSSVKT